MVFGVARRPHTGIALVLLACTVIAIATLAYVRYQFDWDNGRQSHPCHTLNTLAPCAINQLYDTLPRDVTLITHLSVDRLPALTPLIERWSGPIVAAVFVTDPSHIESTIQPALKRLIDARAELNVQKRAAAVAAAMIADGDSEAFIETSTKLAGTGGGESPSTVSVEGGAAGAGAGGGAALMYRFKHHRTVPNRLISRSKVLHRIGRHLMSTSTTLRRERTHSASHGAPHGGGGGGSHGAAAAAVGTDSNDASHVPTPRHHRTPLPHETAKLIVPSHRAVPSPHHTPLRTHPAAPALPTPTHHIIADPPIAHAPAAAAGARLESHSPAAAAASPSSDSIRFVCYVNSAPPASAPAAGGGTSRPPIAYPVNTLRNMALQLVRTQLVFMVRPCHTRTCRIWLYFTPRRLRCQMDVDFVPDDALYEHILASGSTYFQAAKHTAFVVPIFQHQPTTNAAAATTTATGGTSGSPVVGAARSVNELLAQIAAGSTAVNYKSSGHVSHAATNYERWLSIARGSSSRRIGAAAAAANDYAIDYRIPIIADGVQGFEPYVIGSSAHLPRYDERFNSYGGDKITYTYHLHALGFEFKVMANHFISHVAHGRDGGWYDARNYHITEEYYRMFVAQFLPPQWIAYIVAATLAVLTLVAVALTLACGWYRPAAGAGGYSAVNAAPGTGSVFDGCCFRIRHRPSPGAVNGSGDNESGHRV